MKKISLILILTLVIAAPILFLTSSNPVSAAGPTILKFAYFMPEKRSTASGWHWWAEELEKRTNGRVKVEFYPGGTLFKVPAAIGSVIKGVADISMISTGASQKRLPLINVSGLVAMGFPDTVEGNYAAGDAIMALLEKFPEVRAESKDFKWLIPQQTGNYILVSRKKVRVPGDLKGLKIGGTGAKAEYVKRLGATPLNISPPDAYMSLQRGVIDGIFMSWSQIRIYKMQEIAEYFLNFGFSMGGIPVVMNLKSYNSLPGDIKKIMKDITPKARSISIENMFKGMKAAEKGIKAKGRTIITPNAAEKKLWEKAAEPMWDEWVARMKKRGVKEAQKMVDEWKRLRAEASK
ncbi:MAG: TRAP transporter substrate-binding protein DctP [Deltaproteobacteria bacterium]|nr:TRAP transporter substrate-binding protein DctP [Deltaproteobacteria bacterium]